MRLTNNLQSKRAALGHNVNIMGSSYTCLFIEANLANFEDNRQDWTPDKLE